MLLSRKHLVALKVFGASLFRPAQRDLRMEVAQGGRERRHLRRILAEVCR